jgi:hypothetical protein
LLHPVQLARHDKRVGNALRFWHVKVATDFARQKVIHFGMAGNGGAAVLGGIDPPRMFGSFTNQLTTVGGQMTEKFPPFHTRMLSSA